MANKKFTVLIIIFVTLLAAIAQILIKSSLNNFEFTNIFGNYSFLTGIFLYFVATISFLFLLKQNEISVIFPLLTLSYVWITVFSIFILKEELSYGRLFGTFFIIFGAAFLLKERKKL